MSLRVDNIPWFAKPLFYSWAYATAISFVFTLKLHRLLTKRKVIYSTPTLPDSAIYVIWHEDLFHYFLSQGKYQKPYFWMNHPIWFMKPVHIALNWKGVKGLALGSSGHGGQEALKEVIQRLKEGHNTLVAIDGPAGPPKKAKLGAIEMAAATGLPIVPITYHTNGEFRLGGWDRKRVPTPFTSWTIKYQEPIYVDPSEKTLAIEKLQTVLG